MKDIIKNRRKQLNITLEQIGDYVGVSKTTVQRWESGSICNMRRDRIKKLSEILKLDPEILLGAEVGTDTFVRIPVLGRVAAGLPIDAQQDVIGFEEVPQEWIQNDTLFALKIKGDSMEPRIVDGDTIVVRQQSDVNSGDTAVVIIDGEATCKRVIKHADGIVLVSNNTKYEPMVYTNEDIKQKSVAVIGKVIELRAKF